MLAGAGVRIKLVLRRPWRLSVGSSSPPPCAAALLDPSFGIAGATAIAILFGASAASWNGVYLATVATAAPKDSVSLATSGAMALTLSGAIIGPAAFALLAATTGGYEAGFFFVAILAAVSAVGFLTRKP